MHRLRLIALARDVRPATSGRCHPEVYVDQPSAGSYPIVCDRLATSQFRSASRPTTATASQPIELGIYWSNKVSALLLRGFFRCAAEHPEPMLRRAAAKQKSGKRRQSNDSTVLGALDGGDRKSCPPRHFTNQMPGGTPFLSPP